MNITPQSDFIILLTCKQKLFSVFQKRPESGDWPKKEILVINFSLIVFLKSIVTIFFVIISCCVDIKLFVICHGCHSSLNYSTVF